MLLNQALPAWQGLIKPPSFVNKESTMSSNEFDDELTEPEEFDYKSHEMVNSVQIDDLLLEIYEVDESYTWTLVDCYGRTHKSNSGFKTDAHALQAGLNDCLRD
jgi:hypothetical protein